MINSFPGYKYENGKNMFRGEDVGKGGYVYANPGMYIGRIVTYDVASMHPSSIIAMDCFGEYTQRFKDILEARIAIKHKDFEKARTMLDGKLAPYLDDESQAKALAQALKIAINSVYGLTSASFDNPFRDIRNKNNIVALRGALFMVTLRDEVIKRGFNVIHIKTDSIKILNPSEELEAFVMDFGRQYGYNFEIEHIFDRICLVNDAVYVGHLAEDDPEDPGKWTATGAQFQQPYVFKTLFSKEPIVFEDMCETKTVKSALYLDMNERLPDVHKEDAILAELDKEKAKGKEIDEEYYAKLASGISKGHDYHFVGKAGLFTPVMPYCGGGRLVREQDGKYYSATGAKGYRWMESEMVKKLGLEDQIDKSFYTALVDDAIRTINEFGDFEIFVGETEEVKKPKDVPPWEVPCGDGKYPTCFDCPKLVEGECLEGYELLDYITEGGEDR